jgi:hypothetical protein
VPGAAPFPARLALCLALVLSFLAPPAHAFPIAPQTLWELTEQAELVVWAEVENVTMAPLPKPGTKEAENADRYGRELAHLKLEEVWKGSARRGERLQVAFEPDMICPAPDHYEKGLTVLAFLRRDAGTWYTVGLSYGTRYPTSTDELEAYRRAVKGVGEAQQEARVAQWAGRAQDVAAARTTWQVLAASHPATRWDGLYGLVPEADEAHAFYDPRRPRDFVLTPKQRVQLARGFVEHPPRERDLPMMLAALRGYASPEVDRAAASALETVLAASERPPRWAQLALDLLRERYGERPAARPARREDPLLRAFEDGEAGPDGVKRPANPLRSEWTRFKRRHGLRPPLLPLPDGPLVPGTGAYTPL